MKPVMPCGSSNYFHIMSNEPDFVGHASCKNSVEFICTKIVCEITFSAA
jgi:hypothetical protein